MNVESLNRACTAPRASSQLTIAGGDIHPSLSRRPVSITLFAGLLMFSIVLGGRTTVAAPFTIMTQNMYEGTNFAAVFAAQTPAEFIAAIGQTYTETAATQPVARAGAIAQQIADERTIDLYRLRSERLQVGERGKSGAKIIERDTTAQFAHALNKARGGIEVFNGRTFSDFKADQVPWYARTFDQQPYRVRDLGLAERGAGDIDPAYRTARFEQRHEGLQFGQCQFDHAFVELR